MFLFERKLELQKELKEFMNISYTECNKDIKKENRRQFTDILQSQLGDYG